MDFAQVGSVAVCGAEGRLVGALTSYDIVSGSQESVITQLYKTLKNFLKRDTPNSAAEAVSIRANQSFEELLELMVNKKVLHCFIVDDDNYPTGVVTVQDILVALLGKE
jgi:CBS domain-containing protein